MYRDKVKTINPLVKNFQNPFQKRQQPWVVFAISIFTVLLFSGTVSVNGSSAGEIWVANMKGANVQIIDSDSNQVVKTIATGAGAHNVTFSPDGKLAYISNLGTNSITIIDAVSKEKLADVVTDTKAHDVAVSPDGKTAVACNVGAGTITFIDVASKKATHTMATGKKSHHRSFLSRWKYVVCGQRRGCKYFAGGCENQKGYPNPTGC